jgi:NitT/TauT family transport system substrate-binding protein
MLRNAIVLSAVVLTFLGCKARNDTENQISMLTLKGPSAMGMIYLIDSPATFGHKKIKIEILDEPMLVRARLLKESPELAVLPLNMASMLYNKGLPYRLIAIPVWGTLYLFGTDSTVNSWSELKNRRVFMMGKATTPDVLFRLLLAENGLVPDADVILDYSFPTHVDLANAVRAGKADLAVLSEPMASLVRFANPEVQQLLDLNVEWQSCFPEMPDIPQTALIAHSDFLKKHPDWVWAVAESWQRSIERVNRTPDQAARKIVSHGVLPDVNIARQSIPGCNLRFRLAAEIRPEINHYLQVFYTFNPDAVGGKIPDEQFIFTKQDY